MTTSPLRVAVIGAGSIARTQHMPGWAKLPNVQLVGVADPLPASLQLVDASFNFTSQVLDYRELLDDPTINVVDICVPSALHASVTVAALQAGKHVLCEKPMATSRIEAAAILDAWRASGKKLMIGQHMRFEPSVRQLRAYLADHPPGDIYFARGQWMRRRRLPARPGFTDKSQSGGGALYDLGVHLLDLAWWMMGAPRPISVSGVVSNRLARRGDLEGEWGTWDPQQIDVEDFGAGWIRFGNGAVLSLEVSWLAFQASTEFHRLEMLGTRAGVSWPECLVIGETGGIPWDTQLGAATGEKPHHEVIRQFAESIHNDTPVPISPVESANTIAMLDSLYRSSQNGREEPVESFNP